MKLLRVSCIGLLVLALIIPPVYSDSAGKGKGADNGKGIGREEQTHGNPHSASHSSAPEIRRYTIEKERRQADVRANRPAALEKAKWSYNPHDKRGQGNMGKPIMREPYGFDRDSGREKSERGRPIRGELEEPTLNQAEIFGIQFNIGDSYLQMLLDTLAAWQAYYQQNPQYTFFADAIKSLEEEINYYTSVSGGSIALFNPESIDYTLTLSSLQELYGKTLLVTTTLTSIDGYDNELLDYDALTDTFTSTLIQYDAGQVITQQTQEVLVGEDNTLSFSYDPSGYLAGDDGLYANLTVTVIEPESEANYTFSYDRSIYLYMPRCPYGKVYNAKTGQPIVGAKVTVHNEDGSIVALDKASNPTAHNPQTTDATGRYGFKLETNRKYYIVATAPDYEEFKSPVFTEKWHVLREDIALKPN